MILDLTRFIASERPSWVALESMLATMEQDPTHALSLGQARHFHHLYQKASADLARIATFASEPELRGYLEALVARAYAEIHETRDRGRSWRAFRWFWQDFPRAFRRHWRSFALSLCITLLGVGFGGFAVSTDPEAKRAVLPEMFANHLGDPARRVAEEESATKDRLGRAHASFAGQLMVNNIRVSIFTLALGMTFGIGTLVELFYNGVVLGLVAVDYIRAGQTLFLMGWLMPHGVIEIPAILVAGQGGFVLGAALVGWNNRWPLRIRLRMVAKDVITLMGGVAVMLVWAGIIESFLSQHHQPVIAYSWKIGFGALELLALTWFLGWSAKQPSPPEVDR